MSLLNVNKNEVEKVNKLYIKRGKELIEVDELCAGDIGCMTKLSHSSTSFLLTFNKDIPVWIWPVQTLKSDSLPTKGSTIVLKMKLKKWINFT